MIELAHRFERFVLSWTGGLPLWASALAVVVMAALSLVAVVAVVVTWSPDHFVPLRQRLTSAPPRHAALRIAMAVGRNLAGVALVAVGLVMMLPGVPGQGLLTLLIGITLTDLPGKRRFELSVIRRPTIRRAIDRLRARFGKAPLDLGDGTEDGPAKGGQGV